MNVCYVGGAGRLGSALAAWSAISGHQVTIADLNAEAVQAINEGEFESSEPDVSTHIRNMVKVDRLSATTNISGAARDAEVIYIIVPTPSLPDGRFSIETVLEAAKLIGGGLEHSNTSPVVVIVSTVNPGDTAIIQQMLQETAGRGMLVAYSPEFVAQGSIIRDFAKPDVLLIGADNEWAAGLTLKAYEGVVDAKSTHVMSTVSAEIAKIGLNAALVTKTAIAAQLQWLCHSTPGADAGKVLGSIGADTRIGPKFLKPGLRPGGPCLPRDNRALAAACSDASVPANVAVTTDHYGSLQDKQLLRLVLDRAPGNILVVGLTYKPGVPITEESAGLALYESLKGKRQIRRYDELVKPGPLPYHIEWADSVILATPELPEMDLTGKVVIDCWGSYEGDCDKLIVLGVGQ